MLSAAQMAQISRLLDEALELDPEQRRRWFDALGLEHQDLLPALRQALFSEAGGGAGADGLATLPRIGPARGDIQGGSGLRAGELVGPYRLIRPLGQGGMAEVWLAQRADGAFKREVALKLPMPSRHRKDLASRFARERDILAALEHSNNLEAAELLAFVREMIFGRFDSGIDVLRQIVERDPLDTAALRRLAWTLAYAGRLEESEATFRSLLRMSPSVSGGQVGLATSLLYMGRFSEALAEVEKEFEEDRRLCGLAIVYQALGRDAESDAALAELEKSYSSDAAYNIAEIHAYRGEVDAAFEWLDRAYRQRDSGMEHIKVSALLRNLHSDPRFEALLIKMELVAD